MISLSPFVVLGEKNMLAKGSCVERIDVLLRAINGSVGRTLGRDRHGRCHCHWLRWQPLQPASYFSPLFSFSLSYTCLCAFLSRHYRWQGQETDGRDVSNSLSGQAICDKVVFYLCAQHFQHIASRCMVPPLLSTNQMAMSPRKIIQTAWLTLRTGFLCMHMIFCTGAITRPYVDMQGV
jgi:hypothetical protein